MQASKKTSPAHTPGPWTVTDDFHGVWANGVRLATLDSSVNDLPPGESLANARLMAAAPALKDAVANLIDMAESVAGNWENGTLDVAVRNLVSAAAEPRSILNRGPMEAPPDTTGTLGACPCGERKHHYHCPACKCITQVGCPVLPSDTTMEHLHHTREILESAADYAGMGLPIVPLVGKVPAVRNWQLFRATPANVRFWFGNRRCNVGLRTGESGYLVIDTDSPEAEEWVVTHCEESPMQAVSGSGSRHRYYRCPPRKEIRNSQGLFGIHGLDVRGHGGYIVLPPSVHPETGKAYEWLTYFSLPSGLPAFSPRWVYARKTAIRTAIADVVNPDNLIARGRRYVAKIEPAISGAGGHTATFIAALKIVRFTGRNRGLAWELLRHYNATRCEPPWDEKALTHKLDEALKYAK